MRPSSGPRSGPEIIFFGFLRLFLLPVRAALGGSSSCCRKRLSTLGRFWRAPQRARERQKGHANDSLIYRVPQLNAFWSPKIAYLPGRAVDEFNCRETADKLTVSRILWYRLFGDSAARSRYIIYQRCNIHPRCFAPLRADSQKRIHHIYFSIFRFERIQTNSWKIVGISITHTRQFVFMKLEFNSTRKVSAGAQLIWILGNWDEIYDRK